MLHTCFRSSTSQSGNSHRGHIVWPLWNLHTRKSPRNACLAKTIVYKLHPDGGRNVLSLKGVTERGIHRSTTLRWRAKSVIFSGKLAEMDSNTHWIPRASPRTATVTTRQPTNISDEHAGTYLDSEQDHTRSASERFVPHERQPATTSTANFAIETQKRNLGGEKHSNLV